MYTGPPGEKPPIHTQQGAPSPQGRLEAFFSTIVAFLTHPIDFVTTSIANNKEKERLKEEIATNIVDEWGVRSGATRKQNIHFTKSLLSGQTLENLRNIETASKDKQSFVQDLENAMIHTDNPYKAARDYFNSFTKKTPAPPASLHPRQVPSPSTPVRKRKVSSSQLKKEAINTYIKTMNIHPKFEAQARKELGKLLKGFSKQELENIHHHFKNQETAKLLTWRVETLTDEKQIAQKQKAFLKELGQSKDIYMG